MAPIMFYSPHLTIECKSLTTCSVMSLNLQLFRVWYIFIYFTKLLRVSKGCPSGYFDHMGLNFKFLNFR